MADNPQKAPPRERPLSPHLTIYRWQVTMIASITHRVTGVALSVGAIALAWWLVAISRGPESYERLTSIAASPLGLLVLFGFCWSLAFHLLNGIRHLFWDFGYGFAVPTAKLTAALVLVGSLLLAAGAVVVGFMVKAGFGV